MRAHLQRGQDKTAAKVIRRGVLPQFRKSISRDLNLRRCDYRLKADLLIPECHRTDQVRGQHRYFLAAVRRNSHWVAVNEAERIARTTGARIWDLARQGQVDALFLNARRGGIRTECWLR